MGGVHNVVKRHDVGVLELLEERRLPKRGEGHPFLRLKEDLLQHHRLPGHAEENDLTNI